MPSETTYRSAIWESTRAQRLHLAPATYLVYERTGACCRRREPYDPQNEHPPTIRPVDVIVATHGRVAVTVPPHGGGNDHPIEGSGIFTAVAQFRVVVADDYDVRITTAQQEQMFVAQRRVSLGALECRIAVLERPFPFPECVRATRSRTLRRQSAIPWRRSPRS